MVLTGEFVINNTVTNDHQCQYVYNHDNSLEACLNGSQKFMDK